MRIPLILSCFLCLSVLLSAQPNQYTKKALEEEGKYIEGVQKQILGKHEEAIEIFQKIWQSDKTNEVVAFQLSRSYEFVGKNESAIEYGLKAIQLEDNNEFYYIQVAESYENLERYNDAAKLIESFIPKNPEDRYFYENAIRLYLLDLNAEKAIEVLERLEAQVGNEEILTQQKYEIYRNIGDDKKAESALKELITAYPKQVRYRTNLASFYIQKNQIKQATSVFKDILEIDPNNEDAQQFLSLENSSDNPTLAYVNALFSEVDNENISLDDKIKKIIPVLEELAINKNEATGKSLITLTERLVNNYSEEAKAQAILGDAYMMSDKFEEAEVAYQKTLKLNAGVFAVWSQLMEIQYLQGKWNDLNKTTDKALLRFPNQSLIYLYSAFAQNYLGEYKEAISFLEEGLFMTGNNESLQQEFNEQLAIAYILLDNKKYEVYETQLSSNKTAEHIIFMGLTFLKDKKMDKAIETWEKGAEAFPLHAGLQHYITTYKK